MRASRRSAPHEPPRRPSSPRFVEARASGTCLVGDVTNTLVDLRAARSTASCRRRSSASCSGSRRRIRTAVVARGADQIADLTPIAWLRPSIAPHAPYSVSPALLQAIARWSAGRPLSIHLGESAQEIEFLRDGTGEWRALLESARRVEPVVGGAGLRPGGVSRSPRDGQRAPARRPRRAVHRRGAVAPGGARARRVVTCPRSNRWTGAGEPPVDRFYASGVRVAVGTDSLASVDDLNLFAELAEVRRLAPGVPAARILESATLAGRRAPWASTPSSGRSRPASGRSSSRFDYRADVDRCGRIPGGWHRAGGRPLARPT